MKRGDLVSVLRSIGDWGTMVVTRDIANLLRHGRRGPRWAQALEVDPLRVVRAATSISGGDRCSGRVVGGWMHHVVPLESNPKVRFARRHWGDGVPWEQTGIYEYMLDRIARTGVSDGCRNLDDLKRRYAKLDEIFETVRAEGRLRPHRELTRRGGFRALGDVRIHVGPGNEPIFGGAGAHRLAMAQILQLPVIPARVGIVHPESIDTWQQFTS